MAGRMKEKVALVTGGASGIGAAVARLFAAEGAKVVIGDLQQEAGMALAGEMADGRFVHLDVVDQESWSTAIAETQAAFGGLTTLVSCAGITGEAGVEFETLAGWRRVIDVNQTGVFLGMQAALPLLLSSGNGSIVNISSVYGIIGSADSVAYHASKAAVRVMGKSAALEFAQRNVRVNTIFPGLIKTPILEGLSAENLAALEGFSAMGRLGDPDDIASGVLYLASDEAKYVTGAELVIDGGWLAGSSG